MAESYPHLQLIREQPITEKRPRNPFFPKLPDNIAAHGNALRKNLQEAVQQTSGDIGGFDARRLFRFKVEKGFDPSDLQKISKEIEFVSQENEDVVLAFVTQGALDTFEARLASLAQGDTVTNQQVLFALKSMSGWSAEDRKGWALKKEGMPKSQSFCLDVELSPMEDSPSGNQSMLVHFENWLGQGGIEKLDSVKQPGLTIYRVRCDHGNAEKLLYQRDVRLIDLPPQYGLTLSLLNPDIQSLPKITPPPPDAPGVVILDSGIVTGHPLLAPAAGDAQSFLPGEEDATDENGHGTHVAGIALYGNLAQSLADGVFIPELRIFSGKILGKDSQNDTGFVENHIEKAVRYFVNEYSCRIFNLSFGDSRKPYLGGHVRGLAYTLDVLSRELGVLFVVSAGNVPMSQQDGLAWKASYPAYLSQEDWTIIDPAPAINVITVGSLARFDSNFNGQRYPYDPSEQPIARRNQPSPFTRHGPTVGGAIKPELVAYGGNWALNARANWISEQGLGELSTNVEFAKGHLLGLRCGTSFSSPHIAHLAGKILTEQPKASNNAIRALLIAHAKIPEESVDALKHHDKAALRNIVGYGWVDVLALNRSLENDVTLITEEAIENKRHHFFEITIPEDFLTSGRRLREITVALAHTPPVRSTRVAYNAMRLDYRLIFAPNLEHVVKMFNRATDKDEYERIPEHTGASVSPTLRSKGTVQVATWEFKQINIASKLSNQKLFVAVTRNDYLWGEPLTSTLENYALVVCIRDRSNMEARLYTQIQSQLKIRQRTRMNG